MYIECPLAPGADRAIQKLEEDDGRFESSRLRNVAQDIDIEDALRRAQMPSAARRSAAACDVSGQRDGSAARPRSRSADRARSANRAGSCSLPIRLRPANNRSAASKSAGRFALKNGSCGSVENSTVLNRYRPVQTSTLRIPSSTMARRKAPARATGQSPTTGCARPPEAAQAISAPSSCITVRSRDTRSSGRKGASVGMLTNQAHSGAFAWAQSIPARTPASGPAKPSTLSGVTGKPVAANRDASPLAFSTKASTCGRTRSMI